MWLRAFSSLRSIEQQDFTNTKRTTMILRFTMIISLLLLGGVQLSAQTQYQTLSDGVFSDGTNWVGGNVPPSNAANIAITIGHDMKRTVNSDFVVHETSSFRIVTGASYYNDPTVNINKALKINGTGTNNGTITIEKLQIGPNEGTGTFTNNGTITLSGELHIDATLINKGEITADKVKAHGGVFYGGGFIYSGTVEFDENKNADNSKRGATVGDMKFCSTAGGNTATSFTYKKGTGHTVNSANTYVCDGAGAPNNYRLVTAGDLAAGVVLPVELVSFQGRLDNSEVILDWITSTEFSNDYFSIEYSYDGKSFASIGKVKGAGDSQVEHQYSFVHGSPKSGINYYRFKQVDFDGTFEYSEIISVELAVKPVSYRLFPNPIKGAFFSITTEDGQVPGQVLLYNIMGQEIRLPVGLSGVYQLPASLQKGTYIVRMQLGGETYLERLVVP